MNRKPLPPDPDIKDLAKKFRGLRKPCQTVRAFLRENRLPLRKLRQEGWSWAGLGLALTKAGIKYDTGKEWTGDALVQAFSRAQVPLRGYAKRDEREPVTHEQSATLTAPIMSTSPEAWSASNPNAGHHIAQLPDAASVLPDRPADWAPAPFEHAELHQTEPDEPEFKPVRFIDWDEERRSDGGRGPKEPAAPAPAPSQRYIEIMEQLTGKKPPY